jgi:hypothetical protein
MAAQDNTVSRDALSNIYLETYDPSDICAHLSVYDFNRLFSNVGGIMAIKIHNENDTFRICSVGAPHDKDRFSLYIPPHILEDLNIMNKEKENVWIEAITEEPPLATKITIRPYNDSLFAYDLADILQQELDKYYILQEGITIRIRIFDEDHLVHIDKIEPAPIVRLGGEVGIDIGEPIIPSEATLRADTPIPDSMMMEEDDAIMNSIISGLGDALPLAEEVQQTLPEMWWNKKHEWGEGNTISSAVQPLQSDKPQLTAAEVRAARMRFFESMQQKQPK